MVEEEDKEVGRSLLVGIAATVAVCGGWYNTYEKITTQQPPADSKK